MTERFRGLFAILTGSSIIIGAVFLAVPKTVRYYFLGMNHIVFSTP